MTYKFFSFYFGDKNDFKVQFFKASMSSKQQNEKKKNS